MSSSTPVTSSQNSSSSTLHQEPSGLAPPANESGRKVSIAFAEPAGSRRSGSLIAPSPSTSFSSQGGLGDQRTKERQRSFSSPPPPPSFIKRVGFDTFDNKDASDFSLTLKSKHKDYQYTRRSRTFLCGTDQNDYSEFALEWLIDELVDDGDEIVCLRVVDKDSKISSDSAMQERLYRQEARKLMNEIIEKNDDDKAINIVLEFAVGKVHDTIQRMIHIYEPVILIVGTRGRSLGGIQGLLPGSVSKYCLQHSPVPVIVVRPSNKREKKKKKRLADPARRNYMDILERSNDPGIGNLMHHGNNSAAMSNTTTRESLESAGAVSNNSNNSTSTGSYFKETALSGSGAPGQVAASEQPAGGVSPGHEDGPSEGKPDGTG